MILIVFPDSTQLIVKIHSEHRGFKNFRKQIAAHRNCACVMLNKITHLHPAWTAIAAVLAFGSTPVLAQQAVTQPATQTLPAAAPQAKTAPNVVLPPVKAAAAKPVVQDVPIRPVTEIVPVPDAQPSARTLAKAEPVKTKPAPKSAPATDRPTAVKTTAVTSAPTPVEATPTSPTAFTDTAVNETVAPETYIPAAAAPVADQNTTLPANDSSNMWSLLAGLLAILGAGTAAVLFVLRRQKKARAEESEYVETAVVEEPISQTVATTKPATHAPQPISTPAAKLPNVSSNATTLEAMVAQEPSEENPFVSYRNRARRAKFLLSKREQARTSVAANFGDPATAGDTYYVTSKTAPRDTYAVSEKGRTLEDA